MNLNWTKNYFLLGLIVFTEMGFAQNYELLYKAEIRQELPEEVKQEMLKKDAEYGREQVKMNEEPEPALYKMQIAGKESIFTYIEIISNEQDPNKPLIRHAPAGFGTTYHNLIDQYYVQDYDVYGKPYHIKEPLKNWDWKITDNENTMLGHRVVQATAEDENFLYSAWYAPDILTVDGPERFWGLPGLILEVKFENKEHPVQIRYWAESIKELKKAPKIIAPTKGEQTTEAELDALYEKINNERNEALRNRDSVEVD